MIDDRAFRELAPNQKEGCYTAEYASSGIPVPKTRRVEIFSCDEWEEFTEEWASSLKASYTRVARLAGSRDTGLDVVGFISNDTFIGGWENYQCKHYDHPLRPSDVTVEIAKIIYYSYRGE